MRSPSAIPNPLAGAGGIHDLASIHAYYVAMARTAESALEAINGTLESAAKRLETWATVVGKPSCGNPNGKKSPHDRTERKAYLSAAKMLRTMKWDRKDAIDSNDDIPF